MGLNHVQSKFHNLNRNFAFTEQLKNFIPSNICLSTALLQEMCLSSSL